MQSMNKRMLCMVLALVMVIGMLPMAVFAADTVRLYCAAPSNWVKCNVYWWGSSSSNPAWPGNAMTKGDDGIWYYDVPADAGNVIFNNGSAQSADLVMPTDDKVQWNYSAKEWVAYGDEVVEVETVYYLRGSMNNWGLDNPMIKNGDGTYSVTMELAAGTYEFKGAIEDWSWSVPGGANMKLTLAADDTVTFTLNPDANSLTYVLGSGTVIETAYFLRGSMNEWGTSDKMVKQADGTYAITLSLDAGTYEYKAAIEDWSWSVPSGMDNAILTLAEAMDVTFVLDVAAGTLTNNAPVVDVPNPDPVVYDYFVAGDAALCGEEWNPAANQMTEMNSGVYTITFSNVAAGSYEFKVTTGSWETPNYGLNGNNYAIQLEVASDVVIFFNKETEEITCQIYANEEPEPIPVEKYVEFTVDSLGLASNSYTASTATVDGIGVEWIQLGNYGNGIQMRDKDGNTSMFWSTSALGEGITKIEFTYSDTKSVYANNNMIVNFGNDVSGADCNVILTTVADEPNYVITPDANTYGFFYIEWDTGYSSYWKSIKVYYMGDADEECAHSWLAATCTAPKTCELCGETEGDVASHDIMGSVSVVPTCTEPGEWVYFCTVCGAVEDSWNISAQGHKYTMAVTTEPTCTEKGIVTYTCTVCGDSYTDSTAKDIDKVFNAWLEEFNGDQDLWVIANRVSMRLFPEYHEGCDWNCEKIMSAEEFEAELDKNIKVNENMLAYFRSHFNYDADTETYSIRHVGGYGGMIFVDRYLGHVNNGDSYSVYYEDTTVEWLPSEGYAQLEGLDVWPDTLEYEGKVYEYLGMGEYGCRLERTGGGTVYTVEYDGNLVRIVSWCSYSAEEKPAEFDSTMYPNLEPTGHNWVEQICTNCGMSSNCLEGTHEYTSKVTNPTLTDNGYTTFTCKYCGDSYRENYTFPDVPNSLWSYKSVEFAVAKGFFTGYKSGNFGPTDQITRQDFVVVLARLAKVDLSKYSGRTGFPDVKAGDYYEKAVKWASSNGIVNGYQNGNFGVGDKITREQMVTILYNYAKKMGYDTSVSADAAAKLNAYADAHKITGYARPAVIWALSKGVISGMNATTIGPQEYASRGQTATILMNISTKGIMPI